MSDTAWTNLLDGLQSLTYDKFSKDFNVVATAYRSADLIHDIRVHLLVPKALTQEQRRTPRPILVRIHGGYLITGSSLYPPWLAEWVLQLAISKGAIIVSPNYRLMPEATGTDILNDMDAFWAWLQSGDVDIALGNAALGLRASKSQIMVLGESAGGYLAMQLALSYASQISALIAVYPLLDPQSKFYTTAYSKPVLGVQNRPLDVVESHIRFLKTAPGLQRTPVTEADPPDRLALSFAIVQHGLYLQYLGQEDKRLFPLQRLRDEVDADGEARGGNLPPMFICHGQDDSAVPCEGTQTFVQELDRLRPLARCHLELQPGDHGFEWNATIDGAGWLQRGLDFVVPLWLTDVPEERS